MRLKPLAGRVILAVQTESALSLKRGSLYVPDTNVYDQRLIGQVIALADDIVGIEWGDLFEVSRWQAEWWWKRPLADFFSLYGNDQFVVFDAPDGAPERIALGTKHQMAVVRPEMLICRLASRHWVFERKGEPPRPRPIWDRIMVKHRDRGPVVSPSGLVVPRSGLDPVGQVQCVGSEVTDMMPGDWVAVPPGKGTTVQRRGATYSIVPAKHIALMWESEPEEDIEL